MYQHKNYNYIYENTWATLLTQCKIHDLKSWYHLVTGNLLPFSTGKSVTLHYNSQDMLNFTLSNKHFQNNYYIVFVMNLRKPVNVYGGEKNDTQKWLKTEEIVQ